MQSDSYGSPSWHSRFDNLWQTLTSPRVFSALPPYGCHRASPKAISGRTSYLRVRLEFLPYPHLMPTLFNGCGSGPPRSFTTASSWTWVGHPVSGRIQLTSYALFRLGFPSAPQLLLLNLACTCSSPDRSTKSTRSTLRSSTACKHRVSGSLSLPSRGPFHLSLTVLCSIGQWVVFSLTGWSPRVPTRFLVSRGTLDTAVLLNLRLRGSHTLWQVFPGPFCSIYP